MALISWLITAQLACACLLACLYCAVASPAQSHAQNVPRSTGWSDCSTSCGGGSRSHGPYSVVCHVFGCDFQPTCTCGEADIVFIVDRSGSIGEANYWQQKQFMIDLVTGLDRVGDAQTKKTRVAVVSFGDDSTIEFDFNAGHSLNDLQSLVDLIWALPYLQGSTNTAAGLRSAAEVMATQGRVGPKRIGVLLADGGSNIDRSQTIPMATQLKATGAFVYSIGIGNVAESEMRGIASEPSDLFYFYARNYGNLDTIIEDVLNGSCCYSTEPSCVSTGYSACSASCGGGTRTITDTCTYTNYFGDVIHTAATTNTESCCSGPCSPDVVAECDLDAAPACVIYYPPFPVEGLPTREECRHFTAGTDTAALCINRYTVDCDLECIFEGVRLLTDLQRDVEICCPPAGSRYICDVVTNRCYNDSCEHNAACMEEEIGPFVCLCSHEYTGATCQTKITTAAITVPTVTPDPATAATTVPTVTPDPATAATTVPTVTPDPATAATTVPTVTPDPATAATTVPTVTPDPATAATSVPTVTPDPATAATTVPKVTPDPTGSAATSTDAPSSLTLALAVGFSISLSVVLAIAVTLAVRRCQSGAPTKGPYEETVNPAYDVKGRDSVTSVIDTYYEEINLSDSPDGASDRPTSVY